MTRRNVLAIQVHFSDFFNVEPAVIENYGAFNISLINDLPLFVDPFLLFNSDKGTYQKLHDEIIQYLHFLRDKSLDGKIRKGLLTSWFAFPEVKQNWLGYSLMGNAGTGLGAKFAQSLHENLHTVFSTFGKEKITKGSHLEKLCLIEEGVGRDNISDFTTNLIKDYLLKYTEKFTKKYIAREFSRDVTVGKVRFNYDTETWQSDSFVLPFYDNDYVLLTPKDILTKDEVWISRPGLFTDYPDVLNSVPNDQLRDEINNYFLSQLPKEPTRKDETAAYTAVIRRYPLLIEYYIRYKEDHGNDAVVQSNRRVAQTETFFVHELLGFVNILFKKTGFYRIPGNTYQEARQKVMFLKDVIENKGGYRIFYIDGEPVRREKDVHILFRLAWHGTRSDVSREVDDGRGPADFKVSRGSADKTIVEFKLASNSQLKRNLQKQTEIYQKASDAKKALKVILFFSEQEQARVKNILEELDLSKDKNIITIDARTDNKPSASRA